VSRSGGVARTLGSVLHRPAVLPVPRVAVRVLIGAFTDGDLLRGQRVEPVPGWSNPDSAAPIGT